MTDSTLTIATRQSTLALWQANFIADELRSAHPGLTVELLPMSTRGDEILDRSLAKIGGKGLFIKELETALADGTAQLAVHSMKDVPAQMPEGFALPVIGFRADVRDAFVSNSCDSLAALSQGARVGSSSLRRQAQLLALRPDLQVAPVRGNVETRLRKLDEGEFDAIMLASAGLDRLGLAQRVRERLDPRRCVPAVGQGALGIECRADDERTQALLEPLNSPVDSLCVAAERAVSEALGASCSTPLGALAELDLATRTLTLHAVLAAPDGQTVLRSEAQGSDPASVGAEAAQALLAQGGQAILDAL
ncbi:MAG: hydroxymethylbilane synthase [Pseudomonadota bacterium]